MEDTFSKTEESKRSPEKVTLNSFEMKLLCALSGFSENTEIMNYVNYPRLKP